MKTATLAGLFSALFLSAIAIAQEPQSEIRPSVTPEAPPPANAEVTPANNSAEQAEAESDRALKLERKGKKAEAVNHYELAARLSEASINEMERAGLPAESRALDVYFRCATSYLHAGRLLAYLKQEGERKDEDLRKALLYLDGVEKMESERAQRSGGRLNPEVWRVRNAAGYASFLQGQLAQSRVHYRAVLEINPSYKPAEQAIAEINKLEQEQNELFTPQGPTLKKEKNRRLLRRIIATLKLVKDVLPIGL